MSLECFTGNQKTILSIDFDRNSTCLQTCSYCYVNNMERIYPAYLQKIQRNTKRVKDDANDFAKRLNDEYKKARSSKSKQFERLDKVPVRVYGSGDFIPEHLDFLKELKFPFFIISKNLTTNNLKQYIPELLKIPNLTNLQLSFDDANMNNYSHVKHYFNQDRIKFCYTGLPDEFDVQKKASHEFNVFFNISHKHAEQTKAGTHKERCPVDVGELALQKACTFCNRCWRSSVTKQSDWNTSQT